LQGKLVEALHGAGAMMQSQRLFFLNRGLTVVERCMSKSAFLYAVSLIVVILSLVMGTVFYPPNNPFNVFFEAELLDSSGVVIKIERLVTAEKLCRKSLRLRYADDLLSMTLDKHSSRFDEHCSLFLE
jgi:acetylglutamate synthase